MWHKFVEIYVVEKWASERLCNVKFWQLNMHIVLYYSEKNGSTCRDYFRLDNTTGAIFVKSGLDADSGEILENRGVCTLRVQVQFG